jgi:hypothetical protein
MLSDLAVNRFNGILNACATVLNRLSINPWKSLLVAPPDLETSVNVCPLNNGRTVF